MCPAGAAEGGGLKNGGDDGKRPGGEQGVAGKVCTVDGRGDLQGVV